MNQTSIATPWTTILVGLLLCLPWAASCYSPATPDEGIGSFKVEFEGNPPLGEEKSPLAVATAQKPLTLKVKVTALKADGQLDTGFNGQICMFSDRGILVRSQSASVLKDGVSDSITIRVFLAFGKTTLWVTSVPKDTLCPNAADPEDNSVPPVSRVGAAPSLFFGLLSIRNVQESLDSPYDSLLFKKYAVIGEGKMVVTAVSSNGFYATDLDAYKDGKGYDSLFIFTFSAPTIAFGDEDVPRSLAIGDIVKRVEGGVDEFSGHTQLTFPTFEPLWKDKVGGEIQQVPEAERPKPVTFSISDTWSRGKMEKYESAVTEIKDAIALPVIQTQDGWSQFRQWPVLLVEPDPTKNQTKQACEDWIRTELHLHTDASKNGGEYRPCLAACDKKRADKNCAPEDNICQTEANDLFFGCYFECRFNQKRTGILDRSREKGCSYTILMVISNATVPAYDPSAPEHANKRFPYIRGVLQQVRASAFYQILENQYDSEMSNNGYVLWVRQPSDLATPQD